MQPFRGIAMKLASVSFFIVMSSFIKAVSDRVPAGEAVFFRSAFAMPVILIWLAARHDFPAGLRVRSPLAHGLRGIFGTTNMGLGFAGLGLLSLPEVTAIGYAAPLLTVLFAALLLGEKVHAFRISAVVLGLIGVLIVLYPNLATATGPATPLAHAEALGAILVLIGAVFNALAQVQIRRLVATENVSAIVFFFSLTATVLSLTTLPFGWVWPTAREATFLIGCGLFGGVGQIFLTSSYRHADASVIAPFEYASMILALLIGYFVFSETPTLTMLTGAAIVVVAGILIIWREHYLGLERSRQRKAMTPLG
ncbi:aromatic amino acid exporter [mine drainage metagenome]|uniref:Aromatic amino acid exporter n=1 Tax=mine drainage metagenome TaxID=410659 RepID=A0A1J5Q4P0_9ZZZZ